MIDIASFPGAGFPDGHVASAAPRGFHAQHVHERAQFVHKAGDIGMPVAGFFRGGPGDNLVGTLVNRFSAVVDHAWKFGFAMLAKNFFDVVAGERKFAGEQFEKYNT